MSESTVRSHQSTSFTHKDHEEPTEGSQQVPFPVTLGCCGGEELQRRARQQLQAAEVIHVRSCQDTSPPYNL